MTSRHPAGSRARACTIHDELTRIRAHRASVGDLAVGRLGRCWSPAAAGAYAPRSSVAALALALLPRSSWPLLAWCLLPAGRERSQTHTLKPRFVVALDTSGSMGWRPARGHQPLGARPSRRWRSRGRGRGGRVRASTSIPFDARTWAHRADLDAGRARARRRRPRCLRDALQKLADRYRGQNVWRGCCC